MEIKGTLTITSTKHTEGKPLMWSAKEDWQESQDLLQKYAGLAAQPDLSEYYTNEYLARRPIWRKTKALSDASSRRMPRGGDLRRMENEG